MPRMNFYQVLYVLIHAIFTIAEFIWTAIHYISNKVILFTGIRSSKNEIDQIQIQKRLSRISKKPNHLTIILAVEEYTYRDLANLIFWCLVAEIPYISFYDFKGNLKKQEDKLQEVVESVKLPGDNIIWHSQSGALHKNGFVGRKIHVKILEENGKDSIVNLTKTLALSKEKDISIETIDRGLQKYFEFPHPDMGLVSGKRMHILNYPPWQLRLTEFIRLETVSNITFPVFLERLERFSRIEQRLGR